MYFFLSLVILFWCLNGVAQHMKANSNVFIPPIKIKGNSVTKKVTHEKVRTNIKLLR